MAIPVSPPLIWGNPPSGVENFTLIMHDVDTPHQNDLDDTLHWAVYIISKLYRDLPENVPPGPNLPDDSMQIKGARFIGYMGPGAPGNVYHHYVFEIHALDTKLALEPNASRADLMKAMDGHILGKATTVGLAHRTNTAPTRTPNPQALAE